MLNKLLKHEFIATGRIMGAVYAVVAIIAAYLLGSYYIARDTASVGQVLGVTALLIISSCNFILTAVVMITNFQKTLYGDQGYLSFTLPVKSVSLLTSKVITSTAWFVAAFACFMGTAAITVLVVKKDLIGEESYQTLSSMLPMFLGGKTVTTIVTTVVMALISYFVKFAVFTVELYFAISLANTRHFQKKYILWTIIFALATLIIVNKISDIISQNLVFGLSILGNKMSLVTGSVAAGASFIDLTSIIVTIVFGVAFFCGTYYVMNKKVNIR